MSARSQNSRVVKLYSVESPVILRFSEVAAKGGGIYYVSHCSTDDGGENEDIQIAGSCRFAGPASRTTTETVGSSERRTARASPAVCMELN